MFNYGSQLPNYPMTQLLLLWLRSSPLFNPLSNILQLETTFRKVRTHCIFLLQFYVLNIFMEPHEKYHWCLYTVLKPFFSLISQDVFRDKPKYSVGYFIIILAWIISMFGFLYTVVVYDRELKFIALAMTLGSIQV